jgi:hypothetical protein
MNRNPLNSNFLGRAHSPQLGDVSDAFRYFSPDVFVFFSGSLFVFFCFVFLGFPDCGFQEDVITIFLKPNSHQLFCKPSMCISGNFPTSGLQMLVGLVHHETQNVPKRRFWEQQRTGRQVFVEGL